MHEDLPEKRAFEGAPSSGTTPPSYAPSFAAGAPSPETSRRSRRSGLWRVVRESVGVVLLALVVALLLRAFVVQVYKIPSESMMDTLDVGSRIAVNHVPVIGKQVERGDVVVFRDTEGWLPESDAAGNAWTTIASWFGFASSGGQQVVVKRIIGVGGDTVACCDADGNITVNGASIEEPYLAEGTVPSLEEFAVTVPEGYYWVMGDNRQNSADSLYHYTHGESGFVPAESIIGRAQWEFWPVTKWSYLGNRDVFVSVPSQSS